MHYNTQVLANSEELISFEHFKTSPRDMFINDTLSLEPEESERDCKKRLIRNCIILGTTAIFIMPLFATIPAVVASYFEWKQKSLTEKQTQHLFTTNIALHLHKMGIREIDDTDISLAVNKYRAMTGAIPELHIGCGQLVTPLILANLARRDDVDRGSVDAEYILQLVNEYHHTHRVELDRIRNNLHRYSNEWFDATSAYAFNLTNHVFMQRFGKTYNEYMASQRVEGAVTNIDDMSVGSDDVFLPPEQPSLGYFLARNGVQPPAMSLMDSGEYDEPFGRVAVRVENIYAGNPNIYEVLTPMAENEPIYEVLRNPVAPPVKLQDTATQTEAEIPALENFDEEYPLIEELPFMSVNYENFDRPLVEAEYEESPLPSLTSVAPNSVIYEEVIIDSSMATKSMPEATAKIQYSTLNFSSLQDKNT